MPKVVAIAGPNGAGKSTAGPALLRGPLQVDEFVNADGIAGGLSALAPERVAFAAGRLMLGRLRELAARGADFAFESTLASRTFAPWIARLRQTKYEFHLVYLYLLSADLAAARVKERVRAGGHDVPERDVRRRYPRSLRNFFTVYRPIADSWLLLDNSAQPTPIPIAWRNVGGPIHIVRDGPWERLREAYDK